MGREGLNRGGKRGKQWINRMWVNEGDAIVNEIANTIGGKASK
jgi:translation initiation factor IF-1